MTTVVTTMDLELFRMFYTSKPNKLFTEDLYLYVDKDDSTEFEEIVKDNPNVKVYNKNHLRDYFKDSYIDRLRTFKKMYFIHMLLQENKVKDGFYFTDDDVLMYGNMDLSKCKELVYNKELSNTSLHYKGWKKLDEWKEKNIEKDFLGVTVSNFYIPKRLIKSLKKEFNKLFDSFISVIISEMAYVRKSTTNQRSKRGYNTNIFYLDTFFFNVVYANIQNGKEMNVNIDKVTYGIIRNHEKFKDYNNDGLTSIIKVILERYSRRTWPKKQPLMHFCVVHKVPIMKEFYNGINGKISEYKKEEISDFLTANSDYERNRYKKKMRLLKTQNLF